MRGVRLLMLPFRLFPSAPLRPSFSVALCLSELMETALGAYRYRASVCLEKYNWGMDMNAFQLLKEDHKKVSAIFQQLEPTTERAVKTRSELFAELKSNLDLHAHIEETIFYPAIKREAETREIVLEGFEEHHVIKMLLKELEGMPVDTEQWAAKCKVLQENVEHHVEEEEGEMFQKARDVLTEEQINDLGARMEEEKKRQQGQTRTAGA